jgi:hypothetical protein|mmetsp:Transcript_33305/g.59627  ORF Transcript_33305/g.59627 Transcript_33305/m.59627 type:complete len:86 (+) Transcript_33305:197-454(+)
MAGALSEVQREVAREVRDPHFAQDMLQALYQNCAAGSCEGLKMMLRQLRDWGIRQHQQQQEEAGSSRSRERQQGESRKGTRGEEL